MLPSTLETGAGLKPTTPAMSYRHQLVHVSRRPLLMVAALTWVLSRWSLTVQRPIFNSQQTWRGPCTIRIDLSRNPWFLHWANLQPITVPGLSWFEWIAWQRKRNFLQAQTAKWRSLWIIGVRRRQSESGFYLGWLGLFSTTALFLSTKQTAMTQNWSHWVTLTSATTQAFLSRLHFR